MFERFTDRARDVVRRAQVEARELSHNYIGTEHLLLGLLQDNQSVATRALEALGVSQDNVRPQILAIIGTGEVVPSGHIPFTPRAKKVLELSLREALQLGHNYIGTEHLLLGVIREGEGVAAQVLGRLNVELTKVRKQVINLLSGYQEKPPQTLAISAAVFDQLMKALAEINSSARPLNEITQFHIEALMQLGEPGIETALRQLADTYAAAAYARSGVIPDIAHNEFAQILDNVRADNGDDEVKLQAVVDQAKEALTRIKAQQEALTKHDAWLAKVEESKVYVVNCSFCSTRISDLHPTANAAVDRAKTRYATLIDKLGDMELTPSGIACAACRRTMALDGTPRA